MAAAVDSYRAFSARLSTDVGHVVCPGDDTRGPRCSPPPERGGAVFEVLARAADRYRTDESSSSPHARALWRALWAAEPGDLDGAVAELARAVDGSGADARLFADLAALLYTRGRLERRPEDLVAALEHARLATMLDPDSSVARFNLALTLDALSLRAAAAAAWQGFLERADGEGWAAEAENRRDRAPPVDLEDLFAAAARDPGDRSRTLRRLAAAHPELALDHLLQRTLPGWAETWLAGDLDLAASALENEATALAELLARESHELMGLRAVQDLRRAQAEGADRVRLLALGLRTLERGRRELRRPHLETALPALREADELLRAAASPLAPMATVWLSLTEIYAGRHAAAERRLDAALAEVVSTLHPTVEGRLHWHLALSLIRRGMDSRAIDHLLAALATYRSARFDRSEGAIHMLLAERYDRLAPRREAWGHRLQGLEKLRDYPRSLALHNLLLTSATAAQEEGRSEAALTLLEEARRAALVRGRASSTGEVFVFLGRLHRDRGESQEARAALLESGRHLRTLPDSGVKQRLLADAGVEQALLEAATAPRVAAARLDESAAVYRRQGLHIQAVDAAVASARIGLEADDAVAARAGLDEALTRLLRQNRDLAGLPERLHHAARLRPLLEELIALGRAEGGDAVTLLRLAERALTLQVDPDLPAASLAALSASVGAGWPGRPEGGEVVIVFLALEDCLLRWQIGRGPPRLVELPLARSELESRLRRLLEANEAEDAATGRALGAALFAALFAGVDLAAFERLTLVVDRPLHLTPFPALVDGATGRYLIELVDVRLALTVAGEFARADQRRGPPAASASTVTLVGDPGFDPRVYSWLPALPGSRREVEAVARLYPASTVWIGESATRRRLADALAETRILHYAGHALASSRAPGESYLVLAAGGDGETGRLTAGDLAALEMPALDLVVLSACSSIGGRPGRTAALGGLPAVFVAKGAGAVVGTLWRVRDEPAASIMVRFHQALRRRPAAVASALAAAQRAALASGVADHAASSSWGAFAVITPSAFKHSGSTRS